MADMEIGLENSSALHDAVWYRNIDLVQTLLLEGADVNVRDMQMDTPLHVATQHFPLDIVDEIEHYPTELGLSPLHLDVPKLLEIIETRVRHGTDIVDLLLQNGADVNVKDKEESTPLHRATTVDVSDFIEELNKKWPDIEWKGHFRSTLVEAAKDTAIRTVKLLLSNGANVNAVDEYMNIALHIASWEGLSDCVKVFLEHGANVNADERICDYTSLHVAVRKGRVEVVKILLEHGASVNVQDSGGNSPLHELVRQSSPDTFKDILDLLLEHGADLEFLNYYRQTPAHGVAWLIQDHISNPKMSDEQLLGIISELFSRGVDVEAKDLIGNAPHEINNILNRTYRDIIIGFGNALEPNFIKGTFVNHMRRLAAMGAIHMVEKNRPLFFEIMSTSMSQDRSTLETQIEPTEQEESEYYEKCMKEIDNLRNVRISQNITLADVLTLEDRLTLAEISSNIVFQEYAKSDDLDRKFPIYAFLIKHGYERGLKMKLICDKCIISLEVLSSGMMDTDCTHEILQNLSTIELKNLSEIVNR